MIPRGNKFCKPHIFGWTPKTKSNILVVNKHYRSKQIYPLDSFARIDYMSFAKELGLVATIIAFVQLLGVPIEMVQQYSRGRWRELVWLDEGEMIKLKQNIKPSVLT